MNISLPNYNLPQFSVLGVTNRKIINNIWPFGVVWNLSPNLLILLPMSSFRYETSAYESRKYP